jgi:ABC-type multidrug transport system ATPase subunit
MSDRSIVARDLALDGAGTRILDGITLEAYAGRVLAVTGSSGSGKTSLLSVLGGLVLPSAGEVSYDGAPVGTRSGGPDRAPRSCCRPTAWCRP